MDNYIKVIKIKNVEETNVSKIEVNNTDTIVVSTETNLTSGGSTDYSALTGKPKINGVTLQSGNNTSEQLNIIEDKNYIYTQNTPSDVWSIRHTLGKYPSVTIVDSAGTTVIGDIKYIDLNNLIVSFSSSFSGTAYLN